MAETTPLQNLAMCVAGLNPKVGEIGPGMLASLVEQAKRALEPNAICADCQGSGYGGHPDSGANCSTCHGSGGVYVEPVWQALGATTEAEALERVTILHGIAKGDVWVTPRHRRHYAVHSVSGAHIGLWPARETAVKVLRDYPGGTLTELVETGPLSTDNPIDRIWLKVGECLAGMGHADVSPAARRKIEAAIKDAING